MDTGTTISEGRATVRTGNNVFYNPVQEFNRDLSICALNVFARESSSADGITILEALSASGLRSIRYAKEVEGVKKIVANDLSQRAVETIAQNIKSNQVEGIVTANHADAVMLMYSAKGSSANKFDVIDLDPYGCPSMFLDAAVQAVSDGGMLLVTATDMAVLCGNCPETCYTKYGSVSLRVKACHEMALRILLQCIEAHANRYNRYIEPLLSVSVDFYVRVMVRVRRGAAQCKLTTSKLSLVWACRGCGALTLRPLGAVGERGRLSLPTRPSIGERCEHCGGEHVLGGPVWSAAMHDASFVAAMRSHAASTSAVGPTLATWKRCEGVLTMVGEELADVPLYYTLEALCGALRCSSPPMVAVRSALLNAGHRVSYSHANRTSIKTDAPFRTLLDVMRWHVRERAPVAEARLATDAVARALITVEPQLRADFTPHPQANPPSRRDGFLRFQENPTSHWGPGTRATAMVGEQKILKSKRKQNKRKRKSSLLAEHDDDSEDHGIAADAVCSSAQ